MFFGLLSRISLALLHHKLKDMKILLLVLLIAFPFLGSSQHSQAQLRAWLNEVFLDCQQYNQEDEFQTFYQQTDRYTYLYDAAMDINAITDNLDHIALKDKCNGQMARDVVSDIAINPFKYFIDFYKKEKQVIRVGDSNYYMIILPAE